MAEAQVEVHAQNAVANHAKFFGRHARQECPHPAAATGRGECQLDAEPEPPQAGTCRIQVSGEREGAPPRPKPRRRPAWQSVSQTRGARDDDPTRMPRRWAPTRPRSTPTEDPTPPTEHPHPRRVPARNPSPNPYGRNPTATPTAQTVMPAPAAEDSPTGAGAQGRHQRTAAAGTRHRARRPHSHTHTPTPTAMVNTAGVSHAVTASQWSSTHPARIMPTPAHHASHVPTQRRPIDPAPQV